MLDGIAPVTGEVGPVAKAFREWLNGAHSDVLRGTQLANGIKRNFPGGSRQRVSKAGNCVRGRTASEEDLAVIDTWREAHRHVINSFQAILRYRTRDTGIVVAQRHKRKRTIVDKLNRYPTMQLGRMDDVAGCRLIFETVDDLRKFREVVHGARFNHKLKNDKDKYDYIAHPKDSGYRGIHDVYEYDVNSETGRDYKGLLIELQYRTFHQHAWATCVEVVGFLTENQPKFGRGDPRIANILRLASEVIARSFEDARSCLPELSNKVVVEQFLALDVELNFMRMLRGLNSADSAISDKKNIILIFREGDDEEEGELEIRSYPEATVALRSLFELERENPGVDIVLVKGDKPEDVREAFKNYFSDARQFIKLIEEGCAYLLPDRVLAVDYSNAGG